MNYCTEEKQNFVALFVTAVIYCCLLGATNKTKQMREFKYANEGREYNLIFAMFSLSNLAQLPLLLAICRKCATRCRAF